MRKRPIGCQRKRIFFTWTKNRPIGCQRERIFSTSGQSDVRELHLEHGGVEVHAPPPLHHPLPMPHLDSLWIHLDSLWIHYEFTMDSLWIHMD
jgi:hypothetical protein